MSINNSAVVNRILDKMKVYYPIDANEFSEEYFLRNDVFVQFYVVVDEITNDRL